MFKMNLYQGDEGPTNDPGHAVEHLLYYVVVQVLPWREGISLRKQTNLVGNFQMCQHLLHSSFQYFSESVSENIVSGLQPVQLYSLYSLYSLYTLYGLQSLSSLSSLHRLYSLNCQLQSLQSQLSVHSFTNDRGPKKKFVKFYKFYKRIVRSTFEHFFQLSIFKLYFFSSTMWSRKEDPMSNTIYLHF